MDGERGAGEVGRLATQLETLAEMVADGLIVYDRDGKIVRINSVAQGLLGFTAEERGQPLEERIARRKVRGPDGVLIPAWNTPMARALRGEVVHGFLLVFKGASGEDVWISGSAAPMFSDERKIVGALLTFTNISELHRLQEQRAHALRAVSHDMRNALTVALGEASLLSRVLGAAGLEVERESAEAIRTAAQRIDTMMRDLADTLRQEAGSVRIQMRELNLCDVISKAREGFEAETRAERVRFECPDEPIKVLADAQAIERVLINLLDNAVKYSAPEAEVVLAIEKELEQAVVSVQDRGLGISADDLERVFEPYWRGEYESGGLGLGLHIVRTLVDAHGGCAWAESKLGRGSIFYFSLPLVGARRAAA